MFKSPSRRLNRFVEVLEERFAGVVAGDAHQHYIDAETALDLLSYCGERELSLPGFKRVRRAIVAAELNRHQVRLECLERIDAAQAFVGVLSPDAGIDDGDL